MPETEVQAPNVVPSIRYRDAHAAIDFPCEAFGFHRQMVVDNDDGDRVVHAQLTLGPGMIMLGSVPTDEDDPHRLRAETGPSWVYVVLDEVDEDPEGNLWSFGTYRPSSQ